MCINLVQRNRRAGLPSTRLSGWITLSLLSHAVLLAAGAATAPLETPYRTALLTVDITHTAPEKHLSRTVPEAQPPTEQQRDSPPSAHPSREAKRKTTSPASSGGLLAINTYWHVNEVDVRAEPVNEVLLRYPWLEYRRRLAGVVRFTLYINAEGRLDKVELIDADPPGHFEEAALDAVTKLQFSPARKNGRSVKSRKTIEVVFDPNDDIDVAR